jgi:hypothetical protein
MIIVTRFIGGALRNLILLFLKLGKQGWHCTGECTTCQAIQRRGTCKGAIEDSRPSRLPRATRARGEPCLEAALLGISLSARQIAYRRIVSRHPIPDQLESSSSSRVALSRGTITASTRSPHFASGRPTKPRARLSRRSFPPTPGKSPACPRLKVAARKKNGEDVPGLRKTQTNGISPSARHHLRASPRGKRAGGMADPSAIVAETQLRQSDARDARDPEQRL